MRNKLTPLRQPTQLTGARAHRVHGQLNEVIQSKIGRKKGEEEKEERQRREERKAKKRRKRGKEEKKEIL